MTIDFKIIKPTAARSYSVLKYKHAFRVVDSAGGIISFGLYNKTLPVWEHFLDLESKDNDIDLEISPRGASNYSWRGNLCRICMMADESIETPCWHSDELKEYTKV